MPTKENAAAEFDGAQAARFWTPWLAAYTGARFTEIVRLRREDCRRDEGGWSIALGHAKKTRWHRRLVPLHPHLLELGFESFAESRPPGPLFLSGGRDNEASYARLAGAVSRGSKLRSQELRLRFMTEMRNATRGRAEMDEILGCPDPFFIYKFGETPLWALREAIGKLPKMAVEG